ncbi:hypothetical protein C5167_043889 [Papaver somniferum]|uniref:Uncharacterized protein n=1 Tax=Papaver somniferum TaxID=3469 RepID=A0A4Y7L8M3_PAPSO|nr:hypothetical protein C5167_043889 [Papaver somniferum]
MLHPLKTVVNTGNDCNGSIDEQRWLLDPIGQNEQVILVLKIEDIVLDTCILILWSIPSPVAPQASNLTNPNKKIKMNYEDHKLEGMLIGKCRVLFTVSRRVKLKL